MINPLWALTASIIGIITLLKTKLHPGFAIFGGGLILLLLSMPFGDIPALLLNALWNYSLFRLIVILAAAMMLSNLMAEKGLLTRLADSLGAVNPKLSVHLIPAIIGFVPMPAGAVVSAAASQDLFRRIGTTPEQSTFINYWFRHIWEHSMPVYPAVIMAGVILGVPFPDMFVWLVPGTILMPLVGLLPSSLILRRYPRITGASISGTTMVTSFFKASWPIMALIAAILVGIDAMIAFPVVLILVGILERATFSDWKQAFKYGFDYRLLFMLYAVILYKSVVEASHAAGSIYTTMQLTGFPIAIALISIPLIIGFIIPFSTAFIAILLPLFMPTIMTESGLNGATLWLVYGSAMVGMLLSPLHLCLTMSSEFFHAQLIRVYPYLLPCGVLFEVVMVIIYFIAA